MRAVVASRAGSLAEVLAVQELPDPDELGSGQVVVRMVASTINPSDAVAVSGAYGSRTTFPFVAGFEGVGVIERVGPGGPAEVIGRRVLPIGSAGCWAQHKRVDLSWCIPVPDAVPDEVACFAYVNPLTAHLMIERHWRADVRSVAITAATSTIADHLAQLLQLKGVTPIGLVRADARRAVTEPARWKALIDTRDPAWPARLRHESGGELGLALDCVGAEQGLTLVRALAPGAVLVHYGLLSGTPLPVACFEQPHGRRVELFRLRDLVRTWPRESLPALFSPVFEHLRAGRLVTPIARTLPLTSVPACLAASPRGPAGKVLVDCQR